MFKIDHCIIYLLTLPVHPLLVLILLAWYSRIVKREWTPILSWQTQGSLEKPVWKDYSAWSPGFSIPCVNPPSDTDNPCFNFLCHQPWWILMKAIRNVMPSVMAPGCDQITHTVDSSTSCRLRRKSDLALCRTHDIPKHWQILHMTEAFVSTGIRQENPECVPCPTHDRDNSITMQNGELVC